MSEHNQLSSLNNWALRWEIGERLRSNLAVDNPRLPATIENPLNRLRELEGETRPRSFRPLRRWFTRAFSTPRERAPQDEDPHGEERVFARLEPRCHSRNGETLACW
jgi:hypothetical protein